MSQGLRVAGIVESTQSAPASQILVDYLGGTNPVYVGYADPGVATNAARWRVLRILYDANSNPTEVRWGGGTVHGTQVWDNRAALAYS